MKPNNLIIALRYLLKIDRSVILNISGMAIGLSLFVLISLLLNYELSYDKFHSNNEKILQICQQDLKSGELSTNTAFPLAITLRNDFPEVKYVAGVWKMLHEKNSVIKYNDIEYTGFSAASVEPDFLNIFDYHLIIGNPETALDAPENIAVSKSLSEKIFGSDNPVGKVINIANYSFTISQLFKDIPDNSSVKFDILFSHKIREQLISDYEIAWWNTGLQTYVILHDNYPVEDFNNNLKEIPGKYYPEFLKGRSTYLTYPFSKTHYATHILNWNNPPVSYTFLVLLGAISFIILLVAGVNNINLTLARAFKFNVDAGIRRISGASPGSIVKIQVWYSVLSVLAALLLAIPIIHLFLPLFESLAKRPLAGQLNNTSVWMFTIIAALIAAIISGFIPGKIFSKVNPVNIIKSKGLSVKTYKELHNGLLVFQFSLTIALIIAQFFILKQISFMKNADLGYNYDNLISIRLQNIDAERNERYKKSELYKVELERMAGKYGMSEGTITENIPGYYYQNSFTIIPINAAIDESLVISTAVDENFLEVFQIDMIEGRYFSKEISSDRHVFMINETAMKNFGWDNIENKQLKLHHEWNPQPVIGVIKDINITTLQKPISPMIYRFGQHNNFPGFLTFRVMPGNESEAISFMEETWGGMFPDSHFSYLDVKETYFKNYEEEQRLSKIVGIFAFLAITLSLFGLSGLIIYYAESRTKEIGIRKVNGAKIYQVLIMLNKDFVKWISIAFIIATPIAWYAIDKWLQNFTYRTGLNWWVFVMAGLLVLIVALLTVSWQSWQAARRNPVEALRYE